MSRRYLATLAAVAVLVLVAGVWLRGRLSDGARPPAVAPPSEAAALQRLPREDAVRNVAEAVARLVDRVAPAVEYLVALRTSGVRWPAGSVLVLQPGPAPEPVLRPATDSAQVLPLDVDTADPALTATPRWLVAVARRPDGGVVSAAGVAGGTLRGRCGDVPVDEWAPALTLDERLVGAGVFDLEARLVGVVARCDGRVVALTMPTIVRLLDDSLAAERRVRAAYGLDAEPLDAARGAALGDTARGAAGLVVTAVRRAGPADVAGLRAGDVIVAIDSAPVATRNDFRRLDARGGDTLVVARRRGDAVAQVRLTRRQAAADTADTLGALGVVLGAPVAAPGVAIGAVRPDSPASAAGLRAGDRLVRVGGDLVRTADDARRLLGAARSAPRFVVVVRDSVERGFVVGPR